MKIASTKLIAIALAFMLIATSARAQWVQTDKSDIISSQTVSSFAVSGSNIFAGTQDSGVFLSSNNGTSWTQVNNGLPQEYITCLEVSGANVFAGTLNFGAFLTTDNGTHWIAVNNGLIGVGSINAFVVDGLNLFAGTQGGAFQSTDNGSSWVARNSGLTNTDVVSLLVSGSNIFAGTIGGGVCLSTNNGTSWTGVNTGLPVADLFEVQALAVMGTNLFAGTGDHGGTAGIFLSANNGTNWTLANTSLPPDTYFSPLVVIGTNLLAGTNYGVYLTSDNGASWNAAQTGLTGNAKYVDAFAVSGSNLFAGTEGAGVWMRPLSNFAVVRSIPIAKASLSAYPNPFSENTTIRFSSTERGLLQISVVNLLGQEVAQVFRGEVDAGEHSLNWNASEMPPGMYRCIVQMKGQLDQIPIMLIK